MINNFKYAISLVNLLYDIDINDMDNLIEIGLVAYNLIGNKNTSLKAEIVPVEKKTGLIKIPCDADLIESITYPPIEDWNYTSNVKNFGDIESLHTELYIERSKLFVDPLYISGKFVLFRREGNYIYVKEPVGHVCVLYHKEILDEDGLPCINDKEALAIAHYIAYVVKYKEALRTNNANLFQIALNIKQQWLFHCDAARVPEYIDLNEMNKVLDSVSSSNRKVHGKSFKPTV